MKTGYWHDRLARLLGISRASAYRLAAAGELPSRRLGGRVYVVTAKLRDLVGEAPVHRHRDRLLAPCEAVLFADAESMGDAAVLAQVFGHARPAVASQISR